MIVFYCSRRSRSSKLSFCSPQGARAAAVGIHSALCFYTRGEVGQAHSPRNVFTGGRRSVDTIILLFCPFVLASGERVNPLRWDVTSRGFDADHIALWHDSARSLCVCECMRVNCRRKSRPPLGLKIKCLLACAPLMDCVRAYALRQRQRLVQPEVFWQVHKADDRT